MKKVYKRFKEDIDNIYINRSGFCDKDMMFSILRAVEAKLGRNYPVNLSCGSCIVGLVDLFMGYLKEEEELENGTSNS